MMSFDSQPLQSGLGDWAGVVMVVRPDLSRMPVGHVPMCRVMSARTIQLDGRRAINELLPYEGFASYFTSDDGDTIFCEAEYKTDDQGGGHLEVFGRARTNIKEWVIYANGAKNVTSAGQAYR